MMELVLSFLEPAGYDSKKDVDPTTQDEDNFNEKCKPNSMIGSVSGNK